MKILAAVMVAGSVLAGCASNDAGMGSGELTKAGRDDGAVLFSWRSDDGGITGTMVATMPNATYQGPFVQITQQTTRESLGPLWVGWGAPGWRDWGADPWLGDELTTFQRHYSGKVVANLRGDTGDSMRCRITLNTPAAGMSGGGQGECQMSDGRRITAIIERK